MTASNAPFAAYVGLERRRARGRRPRAEYATGAPSRGRACFAAATRGGQFAPSFLVEIHREEIARRARRTARPRELLASTATPGFGAHGREHSPRRGEGARGLRPRFVHRAGGSEPALGHRGGSSGVSRPRPGRPPRPPWASSEPSQVEPNAAATVASRHRARSRGAPPVAPPRDVAVRSHPRSARQHAGAFGVIALFQRDVQHAETGMEAPVAGSTRSGTRRWTRTGHGASPFSGWTERGWTRVSVSTRSAAVQSPRVEARVGGTDCDMPEFSSTNMGRSAPRRRPPPSLPRRVTPRRRRRTPEAPPGAPAVTTAGCSRRTSTAFRPSLPSRRTDWTRERRGTMAPEATSAKAQGAPRSPGAAPPAGTSRSASAALARILAARRERRHARLKRRPGGVAGGVPGGIPRGGRGTGGVGRRESVLSTVTRKARARATPWPRPRDGADGKVFRAPARNVVGGCAPSERTARVTSIGDTGRGNATCLSIERVEYS